MPKSEAQEIKMAVTRWELDLILGLLKKQKFTITDEEDRILTRRFYDRLEKITKPTLPGTD